jgi:hypothetical protein
MKRKKGDHLTNEQLVSIGMLCSKSFIIGGVIGFCLAYFILTT